MRCLGKNSVIGTQLLTLPRGSIICSSECVDIIYMNLVFKCMKLSVGGF